jgi:hypothetical protein
VVTFLALLELVRLKVLVAAQSEAFGEIDLSLAPAGGPEPSPEATAEVPAATTDRNPAQPVGAVAAPPSPA